MAYHYTNYGLFGERLAFYSDLDGYVPEKGDQAELFDYPDLNELLATHGITWEEWVEEAEDARREAAIALSAWRHDLKGNALAFAIACYESNEEYELDDALKHVADPYDLEAWGIIKDEWEAAIQHAYFMKMMDRIEEDK